MKTSQTCQPVTVTRHARKFLLAFVGVGFLVLSPGAEGTAPVEAQKPAETSGEPRASADISEVLREAGNPKGAGRTHALLINGGGSAPQNYLSHFHHLQDMVAILRARGVPPERIAVFSADGDEPGKDLAVRGAEPPDYWLLDGTSQGRALNTPDLTNTTWEGVSLRPARLRDLRRWFAGPGNAIPPGDTLLVFVTDHGNKNVEDPDNGTISMWNGSLSVLEFRALLGYVQPGVRVVNVMSQCYSGAFADAMTPLHSRVPGGNVCGFYSSTSDRPAYGCYAEGRDRDRIGHAFRFIDAMSRHASSEDVHAAVLINDSSPDVPIRTSDVFLERILEDEASRGQVAMDELVDRLLASAWMDRARWEREIRLLDRIGEVYGTFSPRTLGEIKPRLDSLQSLSKELETYEDRWTLALDDLRRDNLQRFLDGSSSWKEKLDPKWIETLDDPGRRSLMLELLPALKEFTMGRADVWGRLQDLRGTVEDAGSAKYRTDVRLAALMRMRTLLMRVAGVQLLTEARASAEEIPGGRTRWSELRLALANLEDCEAEPLGTLDPRHDTGPALESPEPLPPLDQDLAAVQRALPSWLGVRFRPVSEPQLQRLHVERGATLVEQLYPDGPAIAAGIQMSDIVLGPPGAHFTEPNQLREWTMTSPRGKPLSLDLLREGEPLQVQVTLVSFPNQIPALPPPPQAGDQAPSLGSLKMVRELRDEDHRATSDAGSEAQDFTARRHMLFFWATWCGPCKSSVPELMAWSRQTGVPVVAVSDEDEPTLRKFLESWRAPFPELVASDELRRSYLGYGVSGTPTFVLIDADGKIEWRQVGYSPKGALGIPGWSWTGKAR